MTILTPMLAAKMLTVWERRRNAPRDVVYDSSILEAALGLPDHLPVHRGEGRWVKETPGGKWRRVR